MLYKFTFSMLLCIGIAAGANAQRLLAKSHSNYGSSSFTLADSTVYFYSGTRGMSAPNYNIDDFAIPFDSSKNYTSATAQANRITQTFNSSDNLLTSITEKFASGTYSNDKKTNVIYVGSSPDTVVHQNWVSFGGGSWRNSDRTIYTFSGTKKATGIMQTAQMSGGWKNSTKTTWSYGGTGFSSILVESWLSTSSAWRNKTKTDWGSITGGTTETVQTWDTTLGTWTNSTQLIRYYSAGTHLDSARMFNWVASAWSNVYRIVYTYGSGTNPTGATRQDADPFNPNVFINTKEYAYTYTNNYLTLESTKTWNGTAYMLQSSVDTLNRWYYGMWNIGVNKEPNIIPNTIVVYPSPANNMLYISLPAAKAGAQTQFIITDVTGHIQKQWTDNASTTTISLSELPAGNYIVTVSDGVFTKSERFVISR